MNGSKRPIRWRSALFPAGYYGANSIYQGYISLYYTRLGLGNTHLGWISASTAAATLLAQPLWGMLGDRVKERRYLLGGLCLAAAAVLPLALLGSGLGLQLGAAALFFSFFCALLPLGDAILLEAEGERFGAYRLAGGLSFALAGAGFGLVRGRLGSGGALWAAAGMLTLTAVFALLLPRSVGRQRGRRRSALALLRDRDLCRMLAFILPLQMSMGCFYTFYAPHFQSLPGGSDALLGLGYLLSALSEAPYLLLSDRIYTRFGAAKPMCIGALVLALRWLVLGLAQNAWLALASQLLHGGGFIVITVSMARWIAGHVPGELRASGQALLNMVTFGAARIAGNLAGGALAERLGRGGMFLAGAGLCALALICFMPWALRRRD